MSPRTQIVLITAAAVGLFVGLRQIPIGSDLSHTDFRVSEGTSIEFCDPSNPQFIPVVAVKSPVTLSVSVPGQPPRAGEKVNATATLVTSTGKPIAPNDLIVTHTRALHLLVFDPQLQDYQHVHPQPAATPGSWTFEFTPQRAGNYRVFADFTPAATGRGLYASADLEVLPALSGAASAPASAVVDSASAVAGGLDASAAERSKGEGVPRVVRDGIVFELTPSPVPLKARSEIRFQFTARNLDGTAVVLEPVMDALAHLVAVDQERSGFAHLHPAALTTEGSGGAPSLEFEVTIPRAGRYVIWAQVQIGGRDYYAPFWFEVAA